MLISSLNDMTPEKRLELYEQAYDDLLNSMKWTGDSTIRWNGLCIYFADVHNIHCYTSPIYPEDFVRHMSKMFPELWNEYLVDNERPENSYFFEPYDGQPRIDLLKRVITKMKK